MSTSEDLEAALEGNSRARANYDAFPPFSRKAYVHWISNAKREETRDQGEEGQPAEQVDTEPAAAGKDRMLH